MTAFLEISLCSPVGNASSAMRILRRLPCLALHPASLCFLLKVFFLGFPSCSQCSGESSYLCHMLCSGLVSGCPLPVFSVRALECRPWSWNFPRLFSANWDFILGGDLCRLSSAVFGGRESIGSPTPTLKITIMCQKSYKMCWIADLAASFTSGFTESRFVGAQVQWWSAEHLVPWTSETELRLDVHLEEEAWLVFPLDFFPGSHLPTKVYAGTVIGLLINKKILLSKEQILR